MQNIYISIHNQRVVNRLYKLNNGCLVAILIKILSKSYGYYYFAAYRFHNSWWISATWYISRPQMKMLFHSISDGFLNALSHLRKNLTNISHQKPLKLILTKYSRQLNVMNCLCSHMSVILTCIVFSILLYFWWTHIHVLYMNSCFTKLRIMTRVEV